jgi:hypothetical protein
MFIQDPGSGYFLLSQISDPDYQMITVVNVHTKYNFSSFSILFKLKNFIIYAGKFHSLKFNFCHVWDPGSDIKDPAYGKKSSRILGKKAPDPGSAKLAFEPLKLVTYLNAPE